MQTSVNHALPVGLEGTDYLPIAQQVIDFLYGEILPELDWPDLNDAIVGHEGTAPILTLGDLLPVATCIASGGAAEKAVPLAAAWIMYDQASNLFDDLEDQDGKPLIWNEWPVARALQTGLGLIAAAQICLSKLDVRPDVYREIVSAYNTTLALAAREQAGPRGGSDLDAYLRHVVGKSGVVFATVAWSGARVHTNDPEAQKAMRQFGMSLGILLQLLDDCRDLWHGNLQSDLSAETFTLPVIYSLSQEKGLHSERLARLLQAPSKSVAEFREIYEILEAGGAFSYSMTLMKIYERAALAALKQFSAANIESLVAYVQSFLATLDAPR